MLVKNMPHKLRDRPTQCLFLRAVLALCEGRVGSAMREGLLAGVVEHLLSIDADIRWEDIVDAPTGGPWYWGGGGCRWVTKWEPVCLQSASSHAARPALQIWHTIGSAAKALAKVGK